MAKRGNATMVSPQTEPLTASNSNNYGSINDSNGSADSQGLQDVNNIPKKTPRALGPDLLRGLLNIIMSFDHTSLALRVFKHGTGLTNEADGEPIHQFNDTQPYILRTLTHLCAPGFTFLMGMGVVFLVESRLRLGWSEVKIVRYLAERMGVLTGLAVLMGLAGTKGQVWLFNMVIFALAVDYFVAGIMMLAMKRTEKLLEKALSSLTSRNGTNAQEDGLWAKNMSRQAHNALLLLLSIATIWLNHGLSPDNGHCVPKDSTPTPRNIFGYPITHAWLQMWFWPVMDQGAHIMSAFPPAAWLSFSTMGLLYGRVLSAKSRSRAALLKGYAVLAVGFAVVFVLTRVLHVGNLSEDCLQTPKHLESPEKNQYLVSWQSFFYIIKYTPDLAFWSLTMSGTFSLLAILDAIPIHHAKKLTLLTDMGTSALFYYLVHLILIFVGGGIVVDLFGEPTDMGDPMNPGVPQKGFNSMVVFGWHGRC